MQAPPLITFIVPVYHIPDALLCECLQSLFRVELKPEEREIIVVDDGNDYDITHSWSEEWRRNIHCIHQANQGLSVARNVALKQAHGKYIQFVDSDDYLLPSLYGKILRLAIENDADLLSFHFFSTPQQQHLAFDKGWCGPITGAEFMEHHNLRPAAWAYLFKCNILGELQFTPHLLHEDEEFTPQIFLKAKRTFHTTATPYYYRKRSGSITHDEASNYLTKHAPCVENILSKLHTLPVAPQQRAALGRRVSQLTLDYVYNLMRYTHSPKEVNRALQRLRHLGVYPTERRFYNAKYALFRSMVGFAPTRYLLTLLLR